MKKLLYINYLEDDIAFEIRNDCLFPWLEEQGYVSSGKDDDEWLIDEEDVATVEAEVAKINRDNDINLRCDWIDAPRGRR